MDKRTITSSSTGSMLSRVVGATMIISTTFAAVMMNGPAAGGMRGPSISVTTVEQSVSVNRIKRSAQLPIRCMAPSTSAAWFDAAKEKAKLYTLAALRAMQ